MTTFDAIYIQVYNKTKDRYRQKAKQIAGMYVSVLQISAIFAVGSFFFVFLNQMNVVVGSEKAWIVFLLISLFLMFKNWMKYNGKMRSTLSAKYNTTKHANFNNAVLITLPLICIGLGLLILQAG